MDLDGRKIAILKALIEDYIETAEPVGSRTIAKKCDIGLSSATIRNEMSDLEEMGYLAQPHTSAGRIPSNLAYRLYVDNLIENIRATNLEMEFIKQKMESHLSELNRFLDFSAKAISDSTGLTAVTGAPRVTSGAISHFEIVKASEHYLMFILVTNTGMIKKRQVRILTPIDDNSILYLKQILNEELAGCTLEMITADKVERLKRRFNDNFELLGIILEFVTQTMEASGGTEYHFSGKSETLKAPEFSSMDKVLGFLDLVDDQEQITSLMNTASSNKNGITVVIGDESPILKNKDLSMVVSTYRAYGGKNGAIAVIGPKRMNYGKVITTLEAMSKLMSDILEHTEGE
ncbi:MAG: heat-inducible transcription repressor HrcA [Clostridia bacterium]|nr:heat-inducible transcription repressor HrcA [Clostridia bacterium]